jgi:hypothetical protein
LVRAGVADADGRSLTSISIFRSFRRSAYFLDRGAVALELVRRVED